MSPRSIRRAQEREANKKARKASPQQQVVATAETHFPAPEHVSEARLAANRANAQYSTGPNTSDGKAKSSMNAVKSGLTGRTVLLPSDDAALYEQHLQHFAQEFQPVGRRENELVQSLADNAWRLLRIPALEMALYASGHELFAPQFANRDPELQHHLIQMHAFLHYEKQLRNLQIQEGRLRRNRERDTAELSRLQEERAQNHAPEQVAILQPRTVPEVPQEDGFEFSMDDVDTQLAAVHDFITAHQTAFAEKQRGSDPAIAA